MSLEPSKRENAAAMTSPPRVRRHKWTEGEDARLRAAVQKYGVRNWRVVADEVDISSCSAKSCCQRWKSKHQPNLILEPFSDLEDAIIIAALQERGLLQGVRKGPRGEQGRSIPWVEVSTHLRRGARLRHDNMVKNHWNGKLSTSYHKGFMSTAFVRRQKVLPPMRDLMALLQEQHTVDKTQPATRWRAPGFSHRVHINPSQTFLANGQARASTSGLPRPWFQDIPYSNWAMEAELLPISILPSTVLRSLQTASGMQP